MNRSRPILMATATVAIALCASISPAAAGDTVVETKVRFMKLTSAGASGAVSSDRQYCVERRPVVLYRHDGERYRLAGSDRTNEEGIWHIDRKPLALEPGLYRARTFAFDPPDEGRGCHGDTSSPKRLAPDTPSS